METAVELKYYSIEYKEKKMYVGIDSDEVDRLVLGESRLNRELIEVYNLDILRGYLYYENGYKYAFSYDEAVPHIENAKVAITRTLYIINDNKEYISAENITSIKEITQSLIISSRIIAEDMLKDSIERSRNV